MKLVFIENNRPVTDSLTVAETFGKRHDDVLRSIRNMECSEEFRIRNFAETPYEHPQNGQNYSKYIMTQDGFAFLAFGYTGKEAARFKEMYIGEFNRMRDELNQQFKLPQTMSEALRLAADLADKNQTLQLENEELKSKTRYVDQILLSKGTVTITQIAKDYGMSGSQLNKILHEEGVQYKQNRQWLLYRKYQDKGFTKSETIDITRSNGDPDVSMNTRWMQKGRLFIHELLSNRGIIAEADKNRISKSF